MRNWLRPACGKKNLVTAGEADHCKYEPYYSRYNQADPAAVDASTGESRSYYVTKEQQHRSH